MKKYSYLLALVAFVFSSCEKEVIKEVEKVVYADQAGSATLVFDARFGSEDFELNKKYDYQLVNTSGTFDLQFDFSRFRYWVSNVKLVDLENKEVEIPSSYYLIEETAQLTVDHSGDIYPAKKREEVSMKNIPSGEYKGIKFSIGVEPKYNDNLSLTTGELGVLNGMGFDDGWMWFTSYKFLTVAGNIYWAQGTPTSKAIKWDTGSNELYEGAQKEITFANPIKIDAQNAAKVNFEVDVKELLATTSAPWTDNTISQSKKDLMKSLRDVMLQKAIILKSSETIGVK